MVIIIIGRPKQQKPKKQQGNATCHVTNKKKPSRLGKTSEKNDTKLKQDVQVGCCSFFIL